ncbi:hypothetical protein RRG08_014960 [Elysia crispata]|uniref:Uncharacterized protein n=1 Tax=Elysia crispata TaxID=231223 RepID=A0AAE1ABK2_9GAST|nr:hypothetical protein RRG08_014960 [Elysia crispata]
MNRGRSESESDLTHISYRRRRNETQSGRVRITSDKQNEIIRFPFLRSYLDVAHSIRSAPLRNSGQCDIITPIGSGEKLGQTWSISDTISWQGLTSADCCLDGESGSLVSDNSRLIVSLCGLVLSMAHLLEQIGSSDGKFLERKKAEGNIK